MAVAPEAHLLLMHVVELPFESRLRLAGVDEPMVERHRANVRSEATRKLHDLAANAGLDAGRWTPLALDGRSSPWLHIVQQAQDCELIVIGKHGRNALEELLLGSTTSMVIAETSSDVLVCARSDA
jgi:nucleotide-binding universal stress UspA family protein